MRKSSLQKGKYGRWICKECDYRATDSTDRIRHYTDKHPNIRFDPKFMARFWDYPKGVKPRRAKTICKLCGEEIPVGERVKHLEEKHPEVKPEYRKYFEYPK